LTPDGAEGDDRREHRQHKRTAAIATTAMTAMTAITTSTSTTTSTPPPLQARALNGQQKQPPQWLLQLQPPLLDRMFPFKLSINHSKFSNFNLL